MSDEAIDYLFSGPQSGRLYLVESYWPEVSPARVAAADVETSRLLKELGDGGPGARHLGSLLVGEDELLLRLFAGGTAQLINAANVGAGVPVERVVAIVTIAPAPVVVAAAAESVGSLPLANEPHCPRRSTRDMCTKHSALTARSSTPEMRAATRYWICESCGFVYDAKIGDPDGGIPPATALEALDDSWSCPMCGACKHDFTPDP